MSQATGIEWTGATWNPVRGCSRVSEGCRNCYAERQAARFADFGCYAHGFAKRTEAGPRWTGRVELIPEKLDEPLRWRKPRRIFVNSMSDLFHEKLSNEAIAAVFGVMAACPLHTFQILTKRPERMRQWFEAMASPTPTPAGATLPQERASDSTHHVMGGKAPGMRRMLDASWPLPNVWIGVSVEDQATADERIPMLLQTPAAVRFVSYEPALGRVDFRGIAGGWLREGSIDALTGSQLQRVTTMNCAFQADEGSYFVPRFPRLDWLIVGGESGPGARPFDVAWARSAIAQCKAAGVPVFVKQLGANPRGDFVKTQSLFNRKGGNPQEWPEDLRVREFPTTQEPGR